MGKKRLYDQEKDKRTKVWGYEKGEEVQVLQEVQCNSRRVYPEPGKERGRKGRQEPRRVGRVSHATVSMEAWSRELTLAKGLIEHCFLGMSVFISQNMGLMVKLV